MLRREFFTLLPVSVLAAQSQHRAADEVLKELLEGNERFITGHALNPRQKPAEFSRLASGQTPEAVIIGCADSRVPPENIGSQ